MSTAAGLPPSLINFLSQNLGNEYITTVDTIGFNSLVQIFRPRPSNTVNGMRGYVYKTSRTEETSEALQRETDRLHSLAAFFPFHSDILESSSKAKPINIDVPRAINSLGKSINLTTLLPGTNAALIFASCSMPARFKLIRCITGALKALHTLEIPESSIPRLRRFSSPTPSETPAWLVQIRDEFQISLTESQAIGIHTDTEGPIVLVHGDFMLPNILIEMNEETEEMTATGLVDWGECGLGNGEYDVWALMWSIKFNAGLCRLSNVQCQELLDAFRDEYYQVVA